MKTLVVMILIAAMQCTAQEKVISKGAAIFIEEMPQDLDGYIRAELFKKKIPLKVVLAAEEATLIMMGGGESDEKRKWHEGWLTTTRDHATGNVMIVDKASGQLLWASEAGDRSVWWGSLKRGGMRKVADRIVNNLKKEIR